MLNSITFSKAQLSDLNNILELQKIAFLSEAIIYNNYNIEPLKQTIEEIQADFYQYTFLKATIDNKIIGSVKIKNNNDCCYIGKLIVHPQYQNNGVGKKLLAEAEKQYATANSYLLFTGHKSLKNIELYKSVGYKITETFADSNIKGLNIVKMEKHIG